MRITRISLAAFEQTVAKTHLNYPTRKMVREVLVDGRSQVDVAKEGGVTKQCVNNAVSLVKKAYLLLAAPGESSVRVELDLPEVLAVEWNELAKILMACKGAKRKLAIIEKLLTASRECRKELDPSTLKA